MKSIILLVLIFVFGFQAAIAGLPKHFKWAKTDLVIYFKAPPAFVYVDNTQGQRTGADPTAPINDNGRQGANETGGLTQIPLSRVDQNNDSAFDGTNYESKPWTTWEVDIYDGVPQTYVLNIQGMTNGTEDVFVGCIYKKNIQPKVQTKFSVLVQKDEVKKVNVSFDPNSGSLNYQRVPTNDGLLSDIKSACAQDLIEPKKCDFFEDKAEKIEKALDRHEYEKAERLIKSFLCNLGEFKGDGDDDRDDHDAIKEPALDILKADAKALLASLPKHKDHDDDHR